MRIRKFDSNNVEDILPLSSMQNGMLIHYLKNEDSDIYFEKLIFKIIGHIDIEHFIETWKLIIKNNEMLRTEIVWENIDSPIQIIHKNHCGNIEIYDNYTEELNMKFDNINLNVNLREVPFKIVLYRFDQNKYKFVICNHHILFDGWSTAIILKEFITIYNNLCNNEKITLQKKGRYKDFLKEVNNNNKELELNFWQSFLKDFDFTNIEYFNLKNENILKNEVENYTFTISNERKIYDFIRKNQITLATYIYTAWAILIHKYTRNNDIIFGTTVSGRKVHINNIDNIIGLFINTIPLRKKINTNDEIMNVLLDTKEILTNRENFESTSLTDISKYCNSNDSMLFSSIVVIENYPLDKIGIMNKSNFQIIHQEQHIKGEYNLIVNVAVIDHLEITISYNKNYITLESVNEISDYFKNILEVLIIVDNKKEMKISDIEMVNEQLNLSNINNMSKELDSFIDNFDFD